MTNKQVIQTYSTEELAEYLFGRGNGQEYCYGICAYQDECPGYPEVYDNEDFCIAQICKWLEREIER